MSYLLLLTVHIIGMELNHSRLRDDTIRVYGMVERMVMWCSQMRWPKMIFCSTTSDLSGCSRCRWFSIILVPIELPVSNVGLSAFTVLQ